MVFAGEACETNRSLVRTESCWKTRVTVLLHCSQPSRKFQHASGRCVGFRLAKALIGNARQATSEGKSGPVEAGLTGPAATALSLVELYVIYIYIHSLLVCKSRLHWRHYSTSFVTKIPSFQHVDVL